MYKNDTVRIGILGGTFDPVHLGHVNLAYSAVRQLSLDRMIFLPNFISPFKMEKQTASAFDRCNMIRLILCRDEAFELSTYEIDKGGPSYTFDSLVHFEEEFASEYFDKNVEMFFLLGFDSIAEIDTWYRGKELISRFNLVTGERPGSKRVDVLKKIDFFRETYGAHIYILDIEPFDVAATGIRELINNGDGVDMLLDLDVARYIEENKLYR